MSTVPGSSTLGNMYNGSDFTADTQLGGTVLNCSAVRASYFACVLPCLGIMHLCCVIALHTSEQPCYAEEPCLHL